MHKSLADAAATVERASALDQFAEPIAHAIKRVAPEGPIKDTLSGVWLGHPLHPMLTDLPIGFWTSAFVLDLVGGRNARVAASRLVGLGVLSATASVATGLSDWSDTTGPERRVGFTHAVVNGTALACYATSWWLRRRGHHFRGVAWGLAGATAATIGGYLGGHLVQNLGVGVDTTAFDPRPEEWTRAASEIAVDSTPRRFMVGETPVVVWCDDDVPRAVGARCPHRGAPMEEGTVESGVIECPWHGSRFRVADGGVERGPSAMPLPVYDCRIDGNNLEVRARTRAEASRG